MRTVQIRLPGLPPQHWPIFTEQEHRDELHRLLDTFTDEEILSGVRVCCSYICADTGHIRKDCGLDTDGLSVREIIKEIDDVGWCVSTFSTLSSYAMTDPDDAYISLHCSHCSGCIRRTEPRSLFLWARRVDRQDLCDNCSGLECRNQIGIAIHAIDNDIIEIKEIRDCLYKALRHLRALEESLRED